MNEQLEILFMQTRLIRLASEEWNMSIKQINHLFRQYHVLEYIEAGFGIFHCEGDMAVLNDIHSYLERKGAQIHAGVN